MLRKLRTLTHLSAWVLFLGITDLEWRTFLAQALSSFISSGLQIVVNAAVSQLFGVSGTSTASSLDISSLVGLGLLGGA